MLRELEQRLLYYPRSNVILQAHPRVAVLNKLPIYPENLVGMVVWQLATIPPNLLLPKLTSAKY